MKTSTTAALVGVLGLAAIGTAYAMTTAADEPTAVVQTETPEPSAPSTDPTPEASESAVPQGTPAPEVTYTEAETDFLYGAHQVVDMYGSYSDVELLEAGTNVCTKLAGGAAMDTITTFEDLPSGPNGSYVGLAMSYLC